LKPLLQVQLFLLQISRPPGEGRAGEIVEKGWGPQPADPPEAILTSARRDAAAFEGTFYLAPKWASSSWARGARAGLRRWWPTCPRVRKQSLPATSLSFLISIIPDGAESMRVGGA